jgi:hypothetical protein
MHRRSPTCQTTRKVSKDSGQQSLSSTVNGVREPPPLRVRAAISNVFFFSIGHGSTKDPFHEKIVLARARIVYQHCRRSHPLIFSRWIPSYVRSVRWRFGVYILRVLGFQFCQVDRFFRLTPANISFALPIILTTMGSEPAMTKQPSNIMQFIDPKRKWYNNRRYAVPSRFFSRRVLNPFGLYPVSSL